MARPFTLTHQPIRVTATGYQPIYLAMDVSAFDILDIEMGIVGAEGTGTPGATVQVYTGMQNQTDDGWLQLTSFASGATDSYQKQSFQGQFLKYIRWNLTAFVSGTTAATFYIRGMGRSYR